MRRSWLRISRGGVSSPRLDEIREEWWRLTASPFSLARWLLAAFWRVVFTVALTALLGLVYYSPPVLDGVLEGTASPLSLLPWAFTKPGLLALLALVGVFAFLKPFLPERDPYDNY